ncbi:TetR/AcrR family transcriptional regulator [Vibrio sp.]|uniref:TetR/AcrR family transcriptional regulator n=1 Tax=Vibrio viridaestus TaxID=2487322 RepID=A0A3N9TEM2_9VIBR|nr:TetR/AcrR family transcriptional regulator [Vibrio viridaestus]MDC0611439.1 TetR/AcrR family transcriptional regulator [Vibrio sp.]RQW62688.1 TetR/AcrR family transcriptional regulator [Vibrio viridaestus]
MPKRSKEDTEITVKVITEAVVEQLLTIGYDKMSYTTLSEQTGVSRTGISHHFPKKIDFVDTVSDEIVQKLKGYLDFSHGVNGLRTSWKFALSDERFVAIVRLLMQHIVMTERSVSFAQKVLNMLYSTASERIGSDGHDEMERLLGHSLVVMLE